MGILKFKGRGNAGASQTQKRTAPVYVSQYSGSVGTEDGGQVYPVQVAGANQAARREPGPKPPVATFDRSLYRIEAWHFVADFQDTIPPAQTLPVSPITSNNYIHVYTRGKRLITTFPLPIGYVAPSASPTQDTYCIVTPVASFFPLNLLFNPLEGKLWVPFVLQKYQREYDSIRATSEEIYTIENIGVYEVNMKSNPPTIQILWQRPGLYIRQSGLAPPGGITEYLPNLGDNAPAGWQWIFQDYFRVRRVLFDSLFDFYPFDDLDQPLPGWLQNPEYRRKAEKLGLSRYIHPAGADGENRGYFPASEYDDPCNFLIDKTLFVNYLLPEVYTYSDPTESPSSFVKWFTFNPAWVEAWRESGDTIRSSQGRRSDFFGVPYSDLKPGFFVLYPRLT